METDDEYYFMLNSLIYYIIFTSMDVLLSPLLKNDNIFLFLLFHSIFFEILALIQIQVFENLFNVFLSSYCIFGFFKFIYLYVKYKNSNEENIIFLSI